MISESVSIMNEDQSHVSVSLNEDGISVRTQSIPNGDTNSRVSVARRCSTEDEQQQQDEEDNREEVSSSIHVLYCFVTRSSVHWLSIINLTCVCVWHIHSEPFMVK